MLSNNSMDNNITKSSNDLSSKHVLSLNHNNEKIQYFLNSLHLKPDLSNDEEIDEKNSENSFVVNIYSDLEDNLIEQKTNQNKEEKISSKDIVIKNDKNNIKDIIKNIKKEILKISTPELNRIKSLNEISNETSSINNNSRDENESFLSNYNNEEENSSSLWSSQIEEQIEEFATICEDEAYDCKIKARKQFNIGRILQISLIILGSVSVYSSASSLENDIKNSITLISGFSTTIISSIYTMFGFTKKSTISFETSLGLDGLARMLRCEMLKPLKERKSPFELIYYCNMTRDKLLKKKGIND